MPTRCFYLDDERDLKLQLVCKKLGIKLTEALQRAVEEWVDRQPEVSLQINGEEVET